MDDLNAQARAWLADMANARTHATTGERPMDLLAREGLTPLASVPAYQLADPTHRTVSFEALVHFRGSRYSVPPAFAAKPVAVAAVGGQIVVRAGEVVIAEHREAARPGPCVVAREHIEALWKVTAAHVPPPPDARLRAADPAVARVDLRTFEEVGA